MNIRPLVSDDLLELEVRELWCRLLRRDDIGLDEHFFEAGGDSITAVQMLLELEKLAGRPYPESELAGLTIRRIAEVLKSHLPSERGCVIQAKAGSALAPFHDELESKDLWTRLRAVRRMARALHGQASVESPAAGVPFFFCHGDFQARGIYAHQLAALLPEDQPVYLLHPEREPAAGTTVEDLALHYLEAVRRLAPGMPVILGGYCNGGYVAWHLAHLLRAKGVDVLALLLVETPSINAWRSVRLFGSLLRHAPFARELGMRALRNVFRHGVRNFAGRVWRDALERLRGRRTASSASTWWTLVRGMSARYMPPPIDVDVYCFLAEEESRAETEPRYWRPLAARVTEVVVPGNHLSAVIAHRRILANAFAAAIRDAVTRRLPIASATPPKLRSPGAPAARAG